ncbi:MAG: TolC family protein [Gemmatimonadota bacterium]
MRIQHLALALVAVAGSMSAAHSISAQTPAPAAAPADGNVLTLSDALTLARRNNPSLQTSLNARRTAAAQLRSATGAFLPSVNTGFGAGFREGRQSIIEGQAFGAANDQLSTSASLSAQMGLSVRTFNDRREARANVNATEADIAAAELVVRNNVTNQYIAALQAQARANLQDTLVSNTAAQLQLARARFQVGNATTLDVQRAEVADGTQRVAALNARNTAAIEIIRLFQLIGIPAVPGARLDANLPTPPTIDMTAILEQARKSNPQLEALRYREQATGISEKTARSLYFPTLGLSASVSGITNRFTDINQLIVSGQSNTTSARSSCISREEVRAAVGLPNTLAQCNQILFTPEQEARIRESQSQYPFDFTRNPYSLNASLSLPLFDGFRREQQIQQATVQRRNTQNQLRAEGLRVESDVTVAALTFTNAQQTVQLQEQNVRTARTALTLAQERYRVGLASLVELVQARTEYERAETDRITSLFDVQRAFTALEAAVGRPLR